MANLSLVLLILFGVNWTSCKTGDAIERGPVLTPFIVGGKLAAQYEFPWMVRLLIFYQGNTNPESCGATLISSQWLLTAAHCVNKGSKRPSSLIAYLGEYDITISNEPYERQVAFSEIYSHPNYTESDPMWNFDFALIKLSVSGAEPIRFTRGVSPVLLPDQLNMCKSYDRATIDIDSCLSRQAVATGWGVNNSVTNTLTERLKKVQFDIKPFTYCEQKLDPDSSQFSPAKLCAGGDDANQDSCQGDSGGPLMCRTNDPDNYYVQLGVTSYGDEGCNVAGSIPAVYGRVCAALPWIRQIVEPRAMCDKPPQIQNGFLTNGSSIIGSTRFVVCNGGYQLIGDSFIQCGGRHWTQSGICRPMMTTTTTASSTTTPNLEDLQRQLGQSAAEGNTQKMGELIDLHILDPNWVDGTASTCWDNLINVTALIRAAQCHPRNLVDVATVLLDSGAFVNAREGSYGYNALMLASIHGEVDAVALLLDRGADVNAKRVGGRTALFDTAERGNLEIVQLLLLRGADINATSNGRPILIWTAEAGQQEIVRWLLFAGADIDAKDGNGWTALMAAARLGRYDTVKLLIARGASRFGCTQSFSPHCPLPLAVAPMVRAPPRIETTSTVAKGSFSQKQTTVPTTKLTTPGQAIDHAILQDLQFQLRNASEFGNLDMVRQLLELGYLDVNWRRDDDYKCAGFCVRNATVLIQAVNCNSNNVHETVRLLIDNGADVNATETFLGYSALILTASSGQLETVRLLLDRGADVNARDSDGSTALIFAAREGYLETVQLLLDRGADVNATDQLGWTALIKASGSGREQTVRLLLDRGADIDAKDKTGCTALLWAAYRGKVDTVRLLVDRGADINATDNDSWTALLWAASRGNTETVRLLLDRGADINIKSNTNGTALMIAASKDEIEAVRLLLDRGADIDALDKDGDTALISAVVWRRLETVRLLLDRGADMNLIDKSGDTAVTWAGQVGDAEELGLLFRRGADINTKDNKNNTLLMLAAREGHLDAVRLLINVKADIRAKNNDGDTAFILAVRGGHSKTVRLLLDNGENVNATQKDGATSLAIAVNAGQLETVRLLLDAGANVNAKSSDGWTALMTAAYNGHPKIVRLLFSRGASREGCTLDFSPNCSLS